MEYTIKKLAKMAGISTRTLRYYDEINLLKPAKINSSGYRIYGQSEIDKLQQILFYKELDVDLGNIKKIIYDKHFNRIEALKEHKTKLHKRYLQLEILIANVEKSIAMGEGRYIMSDMEKFDGFKQNIIDENEKRYGEEIRKKYGDETVDQSNKKIMNMTQEQYDDIKKLEQDIIKTLCMAFESGNASCELAQKAVKMHKEWLCYYWNDYSCEAHAGVAQMYVDDSRFTEYYDKHQPGLASFLRDAIFVYTGMNK